MVPDYPSTVSRQLSGIAKQGETRIHEVTLLEIRNSNQKCTIPGLNMSIEHPRKNN